MNFVTGGTGLIGSHLLYHLISSGERVRALKRKGSNTGEVKKVFSYYSDRPDELFSKIEWVDGDLLDIFSLEDAMDGVSNVYHCGAMVSLRREDKSALFHNNISGTANLVAAAMEKKVSKVCHVSSVAALGISRNGAEITEETDWNERSGVSAYAVSKYLSEKEVWRAAEEGLNVVIVNPTIVIGPGNWRRSSGSIFKAAARGIGWYTSGGLAYVDVNDLAKSMIALMESGIKNERFIVSAENMSFRKFMELVHSSVHRPLPNKRAGKLLLGLVWRADSIKSALTRSTPLVTREIAHYATSTLSYSNAKIKNTLKIDFMSVAESVRHTAKHFLSEPSATK